MIKINHSIGIQREKMLDGLTRCLNIGRVADALKATRDRDARKINMAFLMSTAYDWLSL